METKFDELLGKLSEQVKSMANTETVIGEEFKIGEYSCKPVIKVGIGFGSGESLDDKSKKGKGPGTGAGAGIGIAPIGFLVTKGDEISFLNVNEKKGFSGILEKMPDMMDKFMDMKEKREKK